MTGMENIQSISKHEDHHIDGTPLRFQSRDGDLLDTIYKNGGLVTRRQIKSLFWSGMSDRAMEKRLAKLHQAGYIDWPDLMQRRSRPIPEPICWLGWRGMQWLAGQRGVQLDLPKAVNENNLRKFETRLRAHGIRWLREPRWIQLEHDIAVIDFRHKLEKDIKQHPHLRLARWIPETDFRSDPDVIKYSEVDRSGREVQKHRGIIPDGYVEIIDESRRINGSPAVARFLLELDRSTHDNPSFGREKALPGYIYVRSPQYRQRFGFNSGRWLVVTTGEVRMKNLMRQTELSTPSGSRVFFFARFDQVMQTDILTAPLWQQPGKDELFPLFTT